jgi:thymidylate synthase (FAD)
MQAAPRIILEPVVELVGYSAADDAAMDRFLDRCGADPWTVGRQGTTSENVIEFASRICYGSHGKGRSNTADHFANIIDQGHTSVLEHAHFSIAIGGVSRTLSHQVVRHRHHDIDLPDGVSQLSQRFVDQDSESLSLGFVAPPAYVDLPASDTLLEDWAIEASGSIVTYRAHLESLMKRGLSRKQAHEAARSLLPECVETRFVLTGNGNSWRHWLAVRSAEGADAEIRRLARAVRPLLESAAPNVFKGAAHANDS